MEAKPTNLHLSSTDDYYNITELFTQLNSLDVVENIPKKSSKNFVKLLESRRSELHTLVDQSADEILKDVERTKNENCSFFDSQIIPIKQNKSEQLSPEEQEASVKNNLSNAEFYRTATKLTSLPPQSTKHHILGPVKTNDSLLQSAKIRSLLLGESSDCMVKRKRQQFPVGELTETIDKGSDFVGMIRNKPFIDCEFQHSLTSMITVIERHDVHNCWVKCRGETNIKLLDKSGRVHQAVAFDSEGIRSICVGMNGTMYLCSVGPNCIKQVALPEMNFKTFCHTGRLSPVGVAHASSGDLFVTLMHDCDSTTKSRRYLIKYNKYGEKVSKIENEVDNSNLFCNPYCVKVNHTDDTVAVVNQISDKLSYLMLFDDNLNLKLRYLGNGEIVKGGQPLVRSTKHIRFSIADIRFSSIDNILISEEFSKSVQLLNPACDVVSTVLIDVCTPRSICFTSDDELWVGYVDGHIKVWKI